MKLNPSEISFISCMWPRYFPRDEFSSQDKRVGAVNEFVNFFKASDGQIFLPSYRIGQEQYDVDIDVPCLQARLSIPDFLLTVQTRPKEVFGCMSMALSIVVTAACAIERPILCYPRFLNLETEVHFGDLKSGTVGQLVSIRGYVVRTTHCKPLIGKVNIT